MIAWLGSLLGSRLGLPALAFVAGLAAGVAGAWAISDYRERGERIEALQAAAEQAAQRRAAELAERDRIEAQLRRAIEVADERAAEREQQAAELDRISGSIDRAPNTALAPELRDLFDRLRERAASTRAAPGPAGDP